jgi:hypothetical protein
MPHRDVRIVRVLELERDELAERLDRLSGEREVERGVGACVEVVQAEQAPQLLDGPRVVLDTQVDQSVLPRLVGRAAGDDEERRRLLAAEVAATLFSGVERREQPLGQWAE